MDAATHRAAHNSAVAHSDLAAPVDLVTGAFGFTGSRIATLLLGQGRAVRTFTRRTGAGHVLAGRLDVRRSVWDDPAELRRQLEGVETLYNTYWMRFPRDGVEWPEIVGNIGALVTAAREAGVRRIVHISVSNAAHDASTAYFRAKADAEDVVRSSGVSYAIVRPTLLFGEGDILINNMAWTLRRFPLFGVPGDGSYRVQPVYVGDVARLVLELARAEEPRELDACGPETFEFDELVRLVGRAVGSRARIVHLPPALVLATTRLIGVAVRDVLLTRDEIRELMESLLASRGEPTCDTRLPDWLATHAAEVGRSYSSELARNFRLAGRSG